MYIYPYGLNDNVRVEVLEMYLVRKTGVWLVQQIQSSEKEKYRHIIKDVKLRNLS